jgi:hypothetical protein
LGLGAFLTLGHREFNTLSLFQIAEAIAADSAEVYEHILAAVTRNEAEAFRAVEPFNGSLFSICHGIWNSFLSSFGLRVPNRLGMPPKLRNYCVPVANNNTANEKLLRPIMAAMALTNAEFQGLMHQLATGWTTQNTELALACFTQDAVYMEPPDLQLFLGHSQLRPYFDALTPGYFMHFHHLWFDEERQIGAGEYSFGNEERDYTLHGVVVVELKDGKVGFWREYQRKGPKLFEDFISQSGKDWQSSG